MKLINKTRYDTRKLRTLIVAVYNRLRKTEGALPQWKRVIFEIDYRGNQSANPNGCAMLDGCNVWLRLPRNHQCKSDALAYLIEHELIHVYGYGHRNMAKTWRQNWDGRRKSFSWAVDLIGETVPVKSEKPTKIIDPQAVRFSRLCKRETAWESKLRRAEKALKKIRASKRYYEKRIAAGKFNPSGNVAERQNERENGK